MVADLDTRQDNRPEAYPDIAADFYGCLASDAAFIHRMKIGVKNADLVADQTIRADLDAPAGKDTRVGVEKRTGADKDMSAPLGMEALPISERDIVSDFECPVSAKPWRRAYDIKRAVKHDAGNAPEILILSGRAVSGDESEHAMSPPEISVLPIL